MLSTTYGVDTPQASLMLETLKNATTRKHTTGFYLDETVDYD